MIVADLIIGFRMFRERFTSRVTLSPPHRIDVAYTEGPFKYLNNHWIFERVPGGCRIDFFVDFEFRSRILQRVIEMLFHEAVRRMVAAFEDARPAALRRPGAASGGQAGDLKPLGQQRRRPSWPASFLPYRLGFQPSFFLRREARPSAAKPVPIRSNVDGSGTAAGENCVKTRT